MKTTAPTFISGLVASIATSFSHRLSEELGADTMKIVRRRNETIEYEGACASHDFCDANIVMSDAFLEVTGEEVDPENEGQLQIWNAAWTYAKSAGFSFEVVKPYRDRILDGATALAKIELEKAKADPEYNNYDAYNKMLEDLSAYCGYDYEKANDEDQEYLLKATAPEQWQYYLDTILPRLRSEK